MANNIKKRKVSELPEATDTSGFWIFGSKTIGGAVTSVKFAFDKITSLFGVTQETGQSITLAPSQKLFTNKNDEMLDLIDTHTGNSKIHLGETEEPGFAVCDAFGNCAYRIDEDGISKMNLDFDITSLFIKTMVEKGFAISDANGNASLVIDAKGETDLKLSKVALKRLKKQLESLDGLLQADYNHIVTYGQSLGEGSQCSPIITSSEFSPLAKMFNHGIKTRYGTSPMYQSFVPHVERQDAENGETPAAGTAVMFIRSSELDGADGKVILSSCCARGAMSVAQLSKGTTWYNNIINDVTNAKRLADAEGKTYRLVAVTWTQGEYDYGNGKDYYKQKLTQLRADLIADVQAITGDDYSALPFVMYQVSSSYTAGKSYPDIGLAQLELAIESDTNGFFLATPIYHLQYADGWHLKNFASKWMGAYYGYALYRVMLEKNWKPLYPVSHTVSGTALYLKFSKQGLVFDKPAYITATIANRGFSVKDASNNELIQSVEISAPDTVKITCSSSPAGLSVTYGFANSNNRNAGELRDNQEVVFPIQGTDYNLYNWCTIFEYKL
ncbi:MAG: sialate O-acetylesterase [Dysgonomonas sp.]